MNARQAVRSSVRLLDPPDRRRLRLATALQMATAFLDLIGVTLLAVVGVLAVSISSDSPVPQVLQTFLDRVGLGDASPTTLIAVLGISAAGFLILKSAIAVTILRAIIRFLANRAATVSTSLTKQFLSSTILVVQRWPSQESAYALGPGVNSAVVGVLGSAVVIASEGALLCVLAAGLLIVNPIVCIATILYFGVIAYLLQRRVGDWSARAGRQTAAAEVKSTTTVQEVTSSFRELMVSDRRDLYLERFRTVRFQAAGGLADTQFIAQLPKYLLEAALVMGAVLLTASQILTQEVDEAVATLALFLAAGTRVAPSIVRLQSAVTGIRGSAGGASLTYSLTERLNEEPQSDANIAASSAAGRSDFRGAPGPGLALSIKDVAIRYPGSPEDALSAVSIDLKPGQSLALVGSTGAGKSTLADLILGVLEPDRGSVKIEGLRPMEAVAKWPGAIAYVPQSVALANGSIRENVGLGIPVDRIDDTAVWTALERAHLADFLRETRDGLDTLIGENGVRLSGGQRQRLGVARAFYTSPRFLVLDEATSALDAETEHAIADALGSLAGDVTTVTVAHRLATIRHSDLVVYLESGRVVGMGSFEEVRSIAPRFDRQAQLLGL